MIQLSIDESIKRLKVEIIAQDWGLSEKRIDLLEAAFACLKQRFKNRKAAHAILIMAGSVLDYVKRKGESTPSESIDFLKEAMAHIVNLYEADEFDPEKDEKLFKGLYFRFNSLKEKIKAGSVPVAAAELPGGPANIGAGGGRSVPEDDFEEDALIPENIDQLRKKVLNFRENEFDLDRSEVDRLVHDLQASLERAEYVGETIRQLLAELMRVREKSRAEESREEERGPAREQTGPENPPERERVAPAGEGEENSVKNCPATELRGVSLAGSQVFIQENAISMIRQVAKEKQQGYLKNSYVPLKDFGTFFKRLSRQFKGSLANIPDKKLKKLTLPIMVPTGLMLEDIPDENGLHMVFVANGQWNGVIACSEVAKDTVTMVKFKSAKNGDFVGFGYADDGRELPLLNVVSILRREGFLTMV
ncbi:MAG: hypothetical protein HY789_02780 [Deltaproteobacteria bacterium]|nr:hypothetical protein [Deltaproteobacteria bacterium]